MKSTLTIFLATAFAATALHAAEPAKPAPKTGGDAGKAAPPATQLNAMFRVFKADGTTQLGQALITPTSGAIATINVTQADAIAMANGRCAFNIKYDEVASAALVGSTNRLFANDALIAQNTKIDLAANTLRTVWTQPYLAAGNNNLKLVLDADGAKPMVGWVRVNVAGTCGAAPAPAPAASAATDKPRTDKPPVPPKPEPKPVPTPAVIVVAGSSPDWRNLNNAWGFSNYAAHQLSDKSFAGYAVVLKLNADLTAAIKAGKIAKPDLDALLARWNALQADATFKAAMALVVPGHDGH